MRCREIALAVSLLLLASGAAHLGGGLAPRPLAATDVRIGYREGIGFQDSAHYVVAPSDSAFASEFASTITNSDRGIGVASTLVLLNNSLLPGNFVSTNGLGPGYMAVDTQNRYLYVADSRSNNVSVVDTATNTLVRAIAVGSNPDVVVYDPSNGDVYVDNYGSDNVSAIDGRTNRVIEWTTVGCGPEGMAFDNSNGDIYVANWCSANVSVIDGATNKVVTSFPVGASPSGIFFDAANGDLYLENDTSGNLSVIDGATNSVVVTIPVGPNPAGIAFDSLNGDIYVAHAVDAGYVSVIDGVTNEVVASIAVGPIPRGIAFDSSNGDIYVADTDSVNVSVINGATNQVVATIPIAPFPQALPEIVAFNILNGEIYVSTYRSDFHAENITVIDGATNRLAGWISLSTFPTRMAFDPVNGEVYVVNEASDNVSVIDATTNKVLEWIPVDSALGGIAVDTQDGDVYVTNALSSNVTVIDGSTNRIIGQIPVGLWPRDIAFDTKNADLYVANIGSDNVTVIDGATNKPIASIPVGWMPYRGPVAITFDSTNGDLYAACWDSGIGSVSVIDGSTNTVVATIPAGWFPTGLAYDSSNDYVYVTNSGSDSNNVTVIDARTNAIAAWVPVGWAPDGVAFDDRNGYVFVANTYGNNVSVIDDTTNKVIAWITVGSGPAGVTFDSSSGDVYVANDFSGSLSVLTSPVVPSYPVTFSETSLPAGTPWSVWLSGTNRGSTGGSIDFAEHNGTFGFSVGFVFAYQGSPSPGSVTVTGVPLAEIITFAALPRYGVTFTESGLPTGTAWSVALTDAAPLSTSGSSIAFRMPNGTYSFTVGTAAGYAASPASGSVPVAGTPVTVSITFTAPPPPPPMTYDVTFKEIGLPAGTTWSVTLGGSTHTSPVGFMTFVEPNGTSSFTVGFVVGYNGSPSSGSVTVAGAALVELIVFTALPRYAVTFTETGLPAGTNWSVALTDGTPRSASGDVVLFQELNGTYSFTVVAIAGYGASPSAGFVTVTGAPVEVSITFTAGAQPTYDVTFTETGLPAGTSWSVTLGGSTHTSPVGFMTFVEPNGTYSFSVAPAAGYSAEAESGSVTVAGRPVAESVTFTSGAGPSQGEPGFTLLGLPTWASYALVATALAIGLAVVVAFVSIRKRHIRPPTPPPADP